MRASSRLALLLVALAPAGGCLALGDLDPSLRGDVRGGLLEVAASTSSAPVLLGADRLGNLTLNGSLLHLPAAAEHERFGVIAVDISGLPPPWRPRHAAAGRVLVTRLAKASPLAIAGLRPNDIIRAVDGAPVATPAELTAALGRVGDGEPVRLAVVHPDGGARTLEARAGGPVEQVERLSAPFLFERSSSSTGGAFGLGPADQLLWWVNRVEHAYVFDEVDPTRYVHRFRWGFLGNLVGYERTTDLRDGTQRSCVFVFGLWIGERLGAAWP